MKVILSIACAILAIQLSFAQSNRSFNLEPVENPLLPQSDGDAVLPETVLDPESYDLERDTLLSAHRTALLNEFILVASKRSFGRGCRWQGSIRQIADFDRNTDTMVMGCKEDANLSSTIRFPNASDRYSLIQESGWVDWVRFSNDGKKLIYCTRWGGNKRTVFLYDFESGEKVELPIDKSICYARFIDWYDDWTIAYSYREGRGKKVLNLRTMDTIREIDPGLGAFQGNSEPVIPAIKLKTTSNSSPNGYAIAGPNDITTWVYSQRTGGSSILISPSGRWLSIVQGARTHLIHLKSIMDLGLDLVPSITFKITEAELAELAALDSGNWYLDVSGSIRNPLLDNAIVGADQDTNYGRFKLVGCGTDFICDAIPIAPTETANEAYERFTGHLSQDLVAHSIEDSNGQSAELETEPLWLVYKGRI
ncbi:MAG: hypothetical protein AAF292_10980 [Pseudomonadota bacterium]